MLRLKRFHYGLIAIGLLFWTTRVDAQQPFQPLEEPGWWGIVVADPYTQTQIDHTDILLRPYRPFHFYGNTVRRMFYRGNPLPTIQDVADSVQALIEGPTPYPIQPWH
jgi:hypothetical protein